MSMVGHRTRAIQIAGKKLDLDPVFLDTETTGFKAFDEVIEIAVLDNQGRVLLDTLVKPSKSIPPSATEVHGISDITVYAAPKWGAVWPQLQQALAGRVVGIYNADFDLKLLKQTCGLNGIAWAPPFVDHFCVMKLFAQYYGELKPGPRPVYRWKSLDFAGKYFKIPEQNAHRAKQDTELTRLVMHKMAESSNE